MQAELPGRLMRTVGLHGLDHLVEADATRVLRAPRRVRDGLPIAASDLDAHVAVEAVRIGKLERSLGAVDAERALVLLVGLEAHGEARKGSALELQRRENVRRDVDRELLAGA